ncbi:MAG: cytochrome c oxidase subunit 3 [Pirellulaceae bacterium]|jgi:cytochrome c oxidase subunit 3|nr:cytochrome c oxidase subunit 3 [Pirellulaceae bacterium]
MRRINQVAEDRRLEQGAWLFLTSLTVFFLSCTFLYAIYVMFRLAPQSGEIQPFYLPRLFILTTVNMLAISVLLHMAVEAVQRERRIDLARYIILAFILGIAFFAVQGSALAWMVSEMLRPTALVNNLYGLTFFLVIVHALHVVGGVAGLTFLLFGLARAKYDHERYFPIRFCALYWHFLDAVWILMLVSFYLAAYISKVN